ncbi:hypothetical protein MHUMG1_02549 [Metarhizium humberi]|uniref:Potassium ion channel Yvc1 n=1 Tax=Metarhizium humberi TaxID=2596975 RepID=A0A9P8S9J7_9HYPO|nr:hypothetical protein MHUMG1_02549 [Metarhizium humberi]
MPNTTNRWRWSAIDRVLGSNGNQGTRAHDLAREEERALLPHFNHQQMTSAVPASEVTKICLRLRHLVQECVPCEMEESRVTAPHSRIITTKVVQAAKEAGGQEYRGCVRRVPSFQKTSNGIPTPPVNVIEKAVDLHSVRVIGSSGYQKCINYLWRGWLVQDENDPSVFIDYKDKDNPNFFVHMDPERMRAPRNQNAAQLLFSVIYLLLYTIAVNSINASGILDGAEVALYLFTLGYICDEIMKFYKAGYHILGFWNAFNGVLYSFLTVSLVLRVIGLAAARDSQYREHYNKLSYNMLSFVAPMFWCRLMLYLDSFRFFGAMLVVLKVMMKESVIFFALLIIIIIGFLQAFIGLDLTDDNVANDVLFIIESMTKAILQSPEFEGFEGFGPPWGIILYYCFTFVVMIILLNILIALYNSAYEDIYENADDEYLALFSQKTMQFVRAPDENVYIAPFNLIEIVISALFEWWMPKHMYEVINDYVMAVIYSPLLFVSAFFETRAAHRIRRNRSRGDEDDDVVEEWEQLEHELDMEAEGWTKTCDSVKPNMEDDPAVLEVRKLRTELEELKAMLKERTQDVGGNKTDDSDKLGGGNPSRTSDDQ